MCYKNKRRIYKGMGVTKNSAMPKGEVGGVYDPEAFFHLFNGTHERSIPECFVYRQEGDFSKPGVFELCEDLSDAVGDREFSPWPSALKKLGPVSR
jgi:hypothetical protein